MSWLRSLRFEDVCSQATFVDYLSGVEMLVARRAALTRRARAGDPRQPPRTDDRARCAAFAGSTRSRPPGCAPRSATGSAFRPKQLSGFLGIVPTEHTSDTKRRQGSITKAGSSHARRLLVEAAHHYRHRPAVGDGLARRQHGQDPG